MKGEAVGFAVGFVVFGYNAGLILPGVSTAFDFGRADAGLMLWMGILSFAFGVAILSSVSESLVAGVTADTSCGKIM